MLFWQAGYAWKLIGKMEHNEYEWDGSDLHLQSLLSSSPLLTQDLRCLDKWLFWHLCAKDYQCRNEAKMNHTGYIYEITVVIKIDTHPFYPISFAWFSWGRMQCSKIFYMGVLCLRCFLILWKNNRVSRVPSNQRGDLVLNGQMRVPK